MKRLSLLIILMFVIYSNGFSKIELHKYATAHILQGNLSITRLHKTLTFKDITKPIVIYKFDVLRTGDSSKVNLNTIENSTISLGGNAILYIQPWKHCSSFGYVQLLFGKAFFSVKKKLFGQKYFNIQTPTATISVKKAKFLIQTASTGSTSLLTASGNVLAQGQCSSSLNITQNQIAIMLPNKSILHYNTTNNSTEQEIGYLHSPLPVDALAKKLDLINIAIKKGILSNQDLKEANTVKKASLTSKIEPQEVTASIQDSKQESEIKLDSEFENDLAEKNNSLAKLEPISVKNQIGLNLAASTKNSITEGKSAIDRLKSVQNTLNTLKHQTQLTQNLQNQISLQLSIEK